MKGSKAVPFEQVWAPNPNVTNYKGTPREGGQALLKKAEAVPIPEKEAVFESLIQQPQGLRKVAFAMQTPLKDRLDYVAIGRKLFLIDELPVGEVPVYDLDIPEAAAVILSARGTPPTVETNVRRIMIPTFAVSTRRDVHYEDITIRRYPVFDRAKERVAIAMAIAEDTEVFRVLSRAADVSPNPQITVTGPFTKGTFADLMATILGNQLVPGSYLLHPSNYSDILKFSSEDLDQVSLNILVETGMFGVLFGTRLVFSTYFDRKTLMCLTTPDKVGRIPERKAVEVKITDFPLTVRYVIVAFEQIGIGVHNTAGVAVAKKQ